MVDRTPHHVGIAVANLDAVRAFYEQTFDFELVEEFTVTGEAFEKGIGADDATGQFARLSMGDVLLELVEYDPHGENRAAPAVTDRGAVHLAFEYDDVAAFYSTLDAAVETISEPVTTESGTTILFLRDPEGNLIELVSPP
ncbi:Lactoylglutathione lyase or related enzyme [Halanaeroarchaeum sp. HSR-CO]|nr:Lactoylglutathione lyase or related enzyme [Halanaeroarchaeum sp. HSR-CO]